MDILNDLTKCNFYYYILRSDKAYLIFNYLRLDQNSFNCIGDAFIRRQPIKIGDNKFVRFLNKDLKNQYSVWKTLNQSKSDQNTDFDQKFIEYNKLGYLLLVKYLFNRLIKIPGLESALINKTDDKPDALIWATTYGHLDIVQYLLKNSSINFKNQMALSIAVRMNNLDIVQYFLNIKYDQVDIHMHTDTLLRYAVEKGHLDIVKFLVSKGANIYAQDNRALHRASEPLRIAAEKGYLEIVQYLVSVGANIHAHNDRALISAAKHGQLSVIQYLVNPYGLNNYLNKQYSANIHAGNNAALVMAAINHHLDVLQYLVSIGANIYDNNYFILDETNIVNTYLISVGFNKIFVDFFDDYL